MRGDKKPKTREELIERYTRPLNVRPEVKEAIHRHIAKKISEDQAEKARSKQDGNLPYLSRLRSKLNAFYLRIRDYNDKDLVKAHGIEVFMEAGLSLNAVTQHELEQVIADEHQQVFGMSRQERLRVNKEEAIATRDYAYFDTPTWVRESK